MALAFTGTSCSSQCLHLAGHSAIVLVTRMKIALDCVGELSCEFSPGKG